MAGFVDEGSALRYFIVLITDRGAECTQVLDPRDEEYYDKALLLLGTWHVRYNALKMILKILNTRDLSPIMALFGYKTTNAQLYLVGCGDEKVTESFIENMTSAMFTVLRIRCQEQLQNSNFSHQQFLEFIGNLAASCGSCSDYIMLLLEVLVPFTMLKAADRNNDMDAFDSAIIKLLPFFFSCGGKYYGPSLVEEIIRMHLRVPLEVLNQRRNFFSVNGTWLSYTL